MKYWLGHFAWRERGGAFGFEGPSAATGVVEVTDGIKPAGSDGGKGLFVTADDVDLKSDGYALLAQGAAQSALTQRQKDLWKSETGFAADGDQLWRLVANHLKQKPSPNVLQPSRRGGLRDVLRLGAQTIRTPYHLGTAGEMSEARAQIQRHHERWKDTFGDDVARKALDGVVEKFHEIRDPKRREDGDEWMAWVLPKYRADRTNRPKQRGTQKTDDFERASLGATWNQHSGTWTIVGSTAAGKTAGGDGFHFMNYDYAFGSDELKSEVEEVSVTANYGGPACRMETSGSMNCYTSERESTSVSYPCKFVAGARTLYTQWNDGGQLFVRVVADGSDIEWFTGTASPAATSRSTLTDTDVAGQLHNGIHQHTANAGGQWEQWLGEDDVVAAGTNIQRLLLKVG